MITTMVAQAKERLYRSQHLINALFFFALDFFEYLHQ
jgi:hypothetical protein